MSSHPLFKFNRNNAYGQPTLRVMVLEAMSGLDKPLSAHEIYQAVCALRPGEDLGENSMCVMVSVMHREGVLVSTGRYNAGDGSWRTFYRLSPGVMQMIDSLRSMHPSKSFLECVDLDIKRINEWKDSPSPKSAPPAAMSPVQAAPKRTPRFTLYITAYKKLTNAIHALAKSRLDSDAADMNNVAREDAFYRMIDIILHEFLAIAPYARLDSGFFWVKLYPKIYKTTNLRLPESDSTDEIYRKMNRVIDLSHDYARCGIAMNERRRSAGSALTMTTIAHTALIWYMISRTSDVERAIPEVKAILDDAVENYVLDGRSVFCAYPVIPGLGSNCCAMRSLHMPAPVPAQPPAESPAESPATSAAQPSPAQPTTQVLPAAAQQSAKPAGEDDGMRISIHIPQSLIARMPQDLMERLAGMLAGLGHR